MVAYHVYLTDFLKTNLTKFAVIWVKRRRKAGFLSPVSSKITLTKEKQRRERESEEEERRRREKSNGCTLSFYNGYFEIVFGRKNGPFQPFSVFKNPARVCTVTNVYEINHIWELQKRNQMKDDPRSCERNLCNCVRSLKKSVEKVLNFFSGFLRDCINCIHNCEDHSSFD